MIKKIRIRRGTEDEWTEANPVLALGEQGYETDTFTLQGGVRYYKMKLGDGETAWADLPYAGYGSPGGGSGGPVSWGDILNKPSTFTPSAHTHEIADVNGLASALAGKAASVHSHAISDVTGLTSALAAKADSSALTSKADLVGGFIPTSQIPAVAITEFLGSVSSESAMLALVGQRGDWCLRTDQALTYVLISDTPTLIGSWQAIQTPASPVSTVNGQTGAVVLGKSDVGLGNVDNTSDADKPVSTAQAVAIAAKQNANTNLTVISGLTPANDDFLQRKSGSWANRTIAQVKADLGITGVIATNIGAAITNIPDVGAIAYLRVNADNTVSMLSASDFRLAIGAPSQDTLTWGNAPNASVGGGVTTFGMVASGGSVAFNTVESTRAIKLNFPFQVLSISIRLANPNPSTGALIGTFRRGATVGTMADTTMVATVPALGQDSESIAEPITGNDGDFVSVKFNCTAPGGTNSGVVLAYYLELRRTS